MFNMANEINLNPTSLQQILEDINFQRRKEMRQLMKDDGYVFVGQGQTYWTEIFVRHFLFKNEPADRSIDSDDLLFFVKKKYAKGSRNLPKYETQIEVFRKDSRKLPIGNPEFDFEETTYLNLIIHQFDYILTVAICTRTSPKELQVLKKHSQKVFASPSRRRMDSKGDCEEITYPNICFMVDNFDEVFQDILVRDGEMVCVELVAKDKENSSVQGVIFLGSIRYDALKKVYDSRQSSLSTKVAQRMTFGLFSSTPQTRCEFVRMKGPAGKGYAEMAVTKPKGSGVETPTSEPGYCMTDMFDSENEDEIDEYFQHQRRLSDSNLANPSTWRHKTPQTAIGAKARSENEGLDCLANEVSEIQAGNLKDDRPVFSTSESQLSSKKRSETTGSPTCCNCFNNKLRSDDHTSLHLSEIYCPSCSQTVDDASSPSCLMTVSKKTSEPHRKTLLSVESEIEYSKNFKKKLSQTPKNEKPKIHKSPDPAKCKNDSDDVDFEYADDATSLNNDCLDSDDDIVKVGVLKAKEKKKFVTGKEELPATETKKFASPNKSKLLNFKLKNKLKLKKLDVSETSFSNNNISVSNKCKVETETRRLNDNNDNLNNNNGRGGAATLPHLHKNKPKKSIAIPKIQTADGTNIYYICDLPKKYQKELDDGVYNPLWTTKGFQQTFHFWKESRRLNSIPLNAFLTYVTLPWFSIAKDLLDHRENPILTF